MIPSTTIPAARAALASAITSQVDDPSVYVFFGPPGTNVPDQFVVLGKTEGAQSVSSLVADGQTHAGREDYFIEVTVSVLRGGDDDQAAEARAWELFDSVCVAVRSDRTLGGAVVEAFPGAFSGSPLWEDTGKGRLVNIDMHVTVIAEL